MVGTRVLAQAETHFPDRSVAKWRDLGGIAVHSSQRPRDPNRSLGSDDGIYPDANRDSGNRVLGGV